MPRGRFHYERSLFVYVASCNSNEAAIRPTLRAVSSRFVAVDYTPGRIAVIADFIREPQPRLNKKRKKKIDQTSVRAM